MSGSGRAAFFDLDGTLLRGESQLSFLLWCLRRGLVSRWKAAPVIVRYLGYLAGGSGQGQELRSAGYELLRGISVRKLEEAAGEFFRLHLAKKFRRHAFRLVEFHRAQGDLTVLLTSACHFLAQHAASALSVEVVIATRLDAQHGCFTGGREWPEPHGEGKRALAERLCRDRGLCARDCVAYTDHHSDVSLLEWVGEAVAVNPTSKLKAIAVSRGWREVNLDGDVFIE